MIAQLGYRRDKEKVGRPSVVANATSLALRNNEPKTQLKTTFLAKEEGSVFRNA